MLNHDPMKPVGVLLREWRVRRHLSQLSLACETEISTRHLSFLETGRSLPSREMVLRLAEQLEIPLRERNSLLVAAGYAPIFQERTLDDSTFQSARRVIDLILAAHEPYPALAVDRHWTLVASNRIIPLLLTGIDPSLLTPPINVLRLTLHPKGLSSRIRNLPEWRGHLFARLRRQIEVSADPILTGLLAELMNYPIRIDESKSPNADYAGVAVPLQIAVEKGILSYLSTTTIFGTPVDITLSELSLETFFPADAFTFDYLNRMRKR